MDFSLSSVSELVPYLVAFPSSPCYGLRLWATGCLLKSDCLLHLSRPVCHWEPSHSRNANYLLSVICLIYSVSPFSYESYCKPKLSLWPLMVFILVSFHTSSHSFCSGCMAKNLRPKSLLLILFPVLAWW